MLVFLKLGGSLITDKSSIEEARPEVIARLCGEIAQARRARRDLSLVIGHGSGSFGHTVAKKYGTRSGVQGEAAWAGFARVAHVASQLNAILLDTLLDTGVPALRIQPSASAVCRAGQIIDLAIRPIEHALDAGLVPLVYGDVAVDETLGGTIISTEEILAYLARKLSPTRILIAGTYEGVLDRGGAIIPAISHDTLDAFRDALGGSEQADVTGGMNTKVRSMLALCEMLPTLTVHIFSGVEPGSVFQALTQDNALCGTRLSA
jgi:isopentenyl phosphate kinase